MIEKNCGNCKHMNLPPTVMPCVACKEGEGLEPSRWEQAGAGRGPELNVPPAITEAKKIGYAIDGIRDHAASLGLLLTDKTLSADALANTILALQELSRDWDRLEEERKALRKEAEHVEDGDA